MTEPKKVRVKLTKNEILEAFTKGLGYAPEEVELEATLIEPEEQNEVWPKEGDWYFVPDVLSTNSLTRGLSNMSKFYNSKIDNERLDNNLICKTKEEATALANYLIEKAKEWRG